MTNTTSEAINADTVTNEQIEALRTEAAEHGDHAQLALCDIALGVIKLGASGRLPGLSGTWTVERARAKCAEVIEYARAEAR